MKKLLPVIIFVVAGCTPPTIENNYVLEKLDGYDVPVCVNHSQKVRQIETPRYALNTCGNWSIIEPGKYEVLAGECDKLEPEIVSYDYCLANMPKKIFLVEKVKDGMTICYDRNNKVELPILYCQKDMISIQNVNTYTSVVQRTNVSQKMTLY